MRFSLSEINNDNDALYDYVLLYSIVDNTIKNEFKQGKIKFLEEIWRAVYPESDIKATSNKWFPSDEP